MIESERRSRSVSIQRTPSKANLSDYQRYFPKFFLQSHTSLAPQNRFSHDSKGVLHVSKGIDEVLSKENNERHDLKQGLDSLRLSFRKVRRTPRIMSVKKAISSMTGSSSESIDETKMMPSKRSSDHMLQQIPIKFLKFAEDVRPPYIGTFSKDPTRGTISSLARNPLARVRPDTNYDYDSEAEWEDPIDGEDLNSEGEEEEEDEDEEEMEGFLDDEEPNAVRRRPMLGDQEPTCCGICWEGEARSSNGSMKPDSRAYRIDVLLGMAILPESESVTDHVSREPLLSHRPIFYDLLGISTNRKVFQPTPADYCDPDNSHGTTTSPTQPHQSNEYTSQTPIINGPTDHDKQSAQST